MRTLILHHLEPLWDCSMKKIGGIDFNAFEEKAFHHIQENDYDKVILTRFEEYKLSDHYLYLNGCEIQVEEYGYGWEADELRKNPISFVPGGTHSEAVYIAPWMRDLSGEIFIGGAFEGECLDDLEVALTALNLSYKKVRSLII